MQQEETVETRGPLLILYGTTSGTACNFALSLSTEASHNKFVPKIQNLGDFPPNSLSNFKLVVLIVATYGEGEPTFDAYEFLEFMKIPEHPDNLLKEVNFAVFGLGNSSYANFCGMGVSTDKALGSLGGNRLLPLKKGDANQNTTQQDFNQWKNELWNILLTKYEIQQLPKSKVFQDGLTYEFEFLDKSTTSEFNFNYSINEQQYEHQLQEYFSASKFYINEIKDLKQKEDGVPSLLVDFSLSSQQQEEEQKQQKEIPYQTAGNVAIYPENSDISCQKFGEFMGYDLEAIFEIRMKNPKINKKPLPTPLKISTYLKMFCDFHGPLTKNQLLALCPYIQSEEKRNFFQNMTTFEGDQDYETQIKQKQESLFSICQNLNVKLPIQELIAISRRLHARNFTISSSNKKFPCNVHLTVSLTQKNDKSFGVCSQNLFDVYKNKNLLKNPFKIRLIPSPFIIKIDKIPVILVATGAGIAPMRALIQEKSLSPDQYGQYILYFGCRKKDEDFIYKDELQQYNQKGTLQELRLAFSRDQEEKIYVQTLIKQDQNKLFDLVFNQKGRIYICGSQAMIDSVIDAFGKIYVGVKNLPVYQQYGQINKLKSEGQLLTEIWS